MCKICAEYNSGTLTFKEGLKNLLEQDPYLEDQHSVEVLSILWEEVPSVPWEEDDQDYHNADDMS